jgi:NADPH-dependent ferric siderophore reductase
MRGVRAVHDNRRKHKGNDMKPAQKTKSVPRLLRVKAASHITPNMIRITFIVPDIGPIPDACEGSNCKIFLPKHDQNIEGFQQQLADGPRPVVRTYTVRHIRKDISEMDIDFVDHGTLGPASAWARNAKPGDFCGFAGPGTIKVSSFYADWYLLAADLSALPVVAATLEAMPRDARGVAFFEILDPKDEIKINAPQGIVQHWLIHPDPHRPSTQIPDAVQAMDWRDGRVQTCIAGESSTITTLRKFLHQTKEIARADTYLSGYWKLGMIEDEHQKMKREEAAASA